MIHDKTSPNGFKSTTWAKDKLDELSKKYLEKIHSWDYMQKQWQSKAHMWVVGYQNLPYVGQDTNATSEGYPRFLESMLRSDRNRMVRRRVGWTVTALTEKRKKKCMTNFGIKAFRKRMAL